MDSYHTISIVKRPAHCLGPDTATFASRQGAQWLRNGILEQCSPLSKSDSLILSLSIAVLSMKKSPLSLHPAPNLNMSYMFKRSYTSLRRHFRSLRNAPPALFTHPQGYSEVVAGIRPSKPGNLFRSAMSTLWTDLSNPYESRQSYWQCLERWKDIEEESFLSYQWQVGSICPSHRSTTE